MSPTAKKRRGGASTLDLIEEAVSLLRAAPAFAHLAYLLGAVPFWIGVLYFVADASRNAYAPSHLVDWSLGVAVLYLWKKTWQSVSAASLRAVLEGIPPEPWTARRVGRTILTQAAVQSWGLVARAIGTVATIPFGWVSTFFQNVTIVGDGQKPTGEVITTAARLTRPWPLQMHSAIAMLYLFTFFVWINIVVALIGTPYLLKTLLGVESVYSRSLFAFFYNTTFLTVTVALTSLVSDPLRKAIFVVRCFRGDALQSGSDLSAHLRRLRLKSGFAACLLACLVGDATGPVRAESAPPPAAANATELDQRIGEVLERREYAWRSPREPEPTTERKSVVGKWLDGIGASADKQLKSLGRQVGRVFRWIRNAFNPPQISTPSGPSIDWLGLSKAVLIFLGIVIVVGAIWLLIPVLRKKRRAQPIVADEVIMPDLRSEEVIADQLPEDGWVRLAREHAARGELVLAIRASWLAGLAHLGRREFIRIARFKSNRDYDRELRRRARDRDALLSAFDANLLSFERCWYGQHEATLEHLQQFEGNLERIRQS